MIDPKKALAHEFPPHQVEIERGRLRSFAHAIGETNPTYFDLDAARAAGYHDLPVPPTFFFSLGLEVSKPFEYLESLGVDLHRILHGEQSFEYQTMAFAGETLVLRDRVTGVEAKRGGALEFITKVALHNPGCSWGLKPPVSRRLLAM